MRGIAVLLRVSANPGAVRWPTCLSNASHIDHGLDEAFRAAFSCAELLGVPSLGLFGTVMGLVALRRVGDLKDESAGRGE